ncbi:MAG: hypothetical protein DWQ04_29195 [Chloroflexi bacterium]|nr:MAG: hypothetical protein DWQ04_29195 [Chloroflexota bacterium]
MSLHDLYRQYHEQVEFLTIYIREAHPIDGWWLGGGLMGRMLERYSPAVSTDLFDPKTIEERRSAAGQCEEALQYGIRTFVDGMDDVVNTAYAAWPTRLYLVGENGRIAYAAGLGPYDFKPAKLKQAIETYLSEKEVVLS